MPKVNLALLKPPIWGVCRSWGNADKGSCAHELYTQIDRDNHKSRMDSSCHFLIFLSRLFPSSALPRVTINPPSLSLSSFRSSGLPCFSFPRITSRRCRSNFSIYRPTSVALFGVVWREWLRSWRSADSYYSWSDNLSSTIMPSDLGVGGTDSETVEE